MRYVIIPGINGSDEHHWQTLWQAEWGACASRISPSSWDEPELDDWCRAIDRAVDEHPSADVVLVAHSLGCLAAACWVARHQPDIRGVLLVAPPDNTGPNFPAEAPTFATVDATPLHVPGLVISSDDDPYCSAEVALRLAADWGLQHVGVGLAGHINSASRLGRWDSGHALLTAFTAGTRRQLATQLEDRA
ncbi:RBBP9/YdeN family alpha/beta hydrolase [Nonomuraea sp. NPDC050451]|uniref:RBBP9/YdeN family alpha/beta hydrolase n=1 Tax=Nonomuraea sp. NPDC050451 TaxID=3364364 RepID=UPI0037AC302C